MPTWGVFPDKSKQGGGPLIDIGTHALDITLWCMDNYEPATVTGSVFEKLGHMPEAVVGNLFGPWDPEKYEVEDSAFGYIKMANGATIFLESAWALNVTAAGPTRSFGPPPEGTLVTEAVPKVTTCHRDYFENYIKAYYGEEEFLVKIPETRRVLALMDAARESARTGKSVDFE